VSTGGSFCGKVNPGDDTGRPALRLIATMPHDRATIADASGEERPAHSALGLIGSMAVHALMLLPVILMLDSRAITRIIPLDVIVVGDQTGVPPSPERVFAPRREAGSEASPAATAEVAPVEPQPDELDLKLQRLAKLRQSGSDPQAAQSAASPSRVAPVSDAVNGPRALGDFIRAQVERRWGPDLAALGNRTFSVLIHVEISGAGAVRRAEIVPDSRFASDQAWQDIARSARNAVLLSSPFTLPPGRYADVMELTLNLDTRDALR
jgi:hypothetical protein